LSALSIACTGTKALHCPVRLPLARSEAEDSMGKWPKLDGMKLSDKKVDDHAYDKQLKKLQNRLLEIQQHYLRTGGRAIVGVDGWDAAGKGGMIQRFVFGLEPRSAYVCRIGAPTVEEQGRHYLWRFWTRLPAPGNWTVFDRTWYGRVLVERVEGFCEKAAWKRAYREINEFERQLSDDGVRIVKILVHVSAEEQKKRMIARLEDPSKHYKIGLEDFRNIAKRRQYLEAYDDMLERTDTDNAPWHVLATDHKKAARLEGLKIIADTLGRGLKHLNQEIDPEIAKAAFKMWGWKPSGPKQ
jgi:polyphosphate kinase 2 (PPK2 family)